MKRIFSWLIALTICTASVVCAGEVPKIDKDELKSMLSSKDLVILDVRQSGDWSASEFKIKDAVRVEDGDLSVAENYPRESTFVLYCA